MKIIKKLRPEREEKYWKRGGKKKTSQGKKRFFFLLQKKKTSKKARPANQDATITTHLDPFIRAILIFHFVTYKDSKIFVAKMVAIFFCLRVCH